MEAAVSPASPPSSHRAEGRATRASVSARADPNVQPVALKQARQHAAAREGIHALSRSFEALLKGTSSLATQQRTQTCRLQLQDGP